MKLAVSAKLSPSGLRMATNVPSTQARMPGMSPRHSNAAFASSLAADVKEKSTNFVRGDTESKTCSACALPVGLLLALRYVPPTLLAREPLFGRCCSGAAAGLVLNRDLERSRDGARLFDPDGVVGRLLDRYHPLD
ncbi:hypothetical protein MTO96_046649 [Rhipicephalus appendiculatus]